MKVVHVIPAFSAQEGGTYTALRGLCEALRPHSIDNVIFTTGTNADYLIASEEFADVHFFPRSFLSRWWSGYSAKLAALFENISASFDLLHIHSLWHYPMYLAVKKAQEKSLPYVISPHGCLEGAAQQNKNLRKRLYSFLWQKKVLRQSFGMQAISINEEDNIHQQGARKNIQMIPNGLWVNEYSEDYEKDSLATEYPWISGKKIILFLGRLDPIKGLDLLIEAFSRVVQKNKDVVLCIAGPDQIGYQASLEQQINTLNLGDRVFFTGMLYEETKKKFLSAATVVAVSSHSEVRSLAALEALASGTPVVITRACSFPEVEQYQAGFVVSGEATEISTALLTLLSDDQLRASMGHNGRQLVRECFDWKSLGKQMFQFYQEAVS